MNLKGIGFMDILIIVIMTSLLFIVANAINQLNKLDRLEKKVNELENDFYLPDRVIDKAGETFTREKGTNSYSSTYIFRRDDFYCEYNNSNGKLIRGDDECAPSIWIN